MFTYFLLQDDIDDTAAQFLLPTKEWIHIQKQSFSILRDRISSLRAKYKDQIMENQEKYLNIPSEDDENSWLEYCQNNEPLLTTMFRIPQRTLEIIVEFQAKWLNNDLAMYTENKRWLSPWIYSSLACLHLPLEPNMHSILRDIAKTCIRLRNNMCTTDLDSVLPLNLLICIVSHNFNQLDLSGRLQ